MCSFAEARHTAKDGEFGAMSRREFVTGASGALFASTASAANGRESTGVDLDRCADHLLAIDPELATTAGFDVGPLAALRGRLSDRSRASGLAQARFCDLWLRSIDAAAAREPEPTARSVDVATLRFGLELGRDGSKLGYGETTLSAAMSESATPYLVNQLMGDWTSVPDLLAYQHPLGGEADVYAYLSRLAQLPARLDQETNRLRSDAARGVILPRMPMASCLHGIAATRDQPTAASQLVAPLAERSGPAGNAVATASTLVERQVRPALSRQFEAMEAFERRAPTEPGLWRLPDGDAFYAWSLRVGTGTTLSPEEVHAIGVEQCGEIAGRMDAGLRTLGLTRGSVAQRMASLASDPRYLFPSDDSGRAEILAYLADRIAAIRPRLREAFRSVPDAPVVIKRVPRASERGGPSGYLDPAPRDGSRPSTYFINLRSTAEWPRFALPTLTYHETIPGHAWQSAYLALGTSLPRVRSLLQFNAYVEGWALYAEQLAEELGMYEDDPAGRLGHWQNQLFRAGRLVVDTGIHARRWTRERAATWLTDLTGRPRSVMESEVDRYSVAPGQACGYEIGHNEFERIRARTRGRLGGGFDLRTFNDVVLRSGPTSFAVLERAVDQISSPARRAIRGVNLGDHK
jgi:uncharacterized protein (DUF885 family)